MELSMSYLVLLCFAILAALYVLHYWKNIACRRSCKSEVNLTGKTVIVTGANSGIGKVTAQDLARRGARVILACRNLRKAQDAAEEIKARTGNSEVVVGHLDLASLQSVREFAKEIIEGEDRLDILINNAGIAVVSGEPLTEDGFPALFGVNHFGHFLLTNLLLDLLRKSAPSRVVTVSSNYHRSVWSPLDLTPAVNDGGIPGGNGDGGALYPRLNAYNHSKLANILFSRELARRLALTGVVSVSLHPGVIFTPIWRNVWSRIWILTPLYYILGPLMWLVLIDEEAGAQTILHCTLDESIVNLSGQYFSNCVVSEPSTMAQDDELATRLWAVSCQATGLAEE
ncbi:retinol dehydrogenase 12-like isoform X2 [Acanthaster planci]|uniref:Retinol dehydrogenase 12-like isoform X2 n=1 Tax=Acanthaster planci TaxID=133434 RepID=A0A8B7YU94_ACAPL|nr:retinol dehydrogenase 12-like isoform X2 [Acanthaster planci]